MTNAFTDQYRHDPAGPVALTPRAAERGGPDSGGGGVGVDFFLNLTASIGTLAEQMQADRDERHSERESRQPPGDAQLFASGVVPASGNLLLDLGSVPVGRVWQVRWLNVGGVQITTAAAGKAFVFAQGAPPNDLNLTNCRANFQTLPPSPTPSFGTHQFFLRWTEHLWVMFVGATAGQQYAATARIEDWHDGSFTRTFTAE